ncbi:MarC family protein [Estrella lausannensis]|uniref:UPF0056 membrane protein n=1 Tax=Estrella lausannensis TaxID=483423 RepID=A0A0H5DSX9_9BACT|nr:MarC family protein [Estrella lausannensis]CRX39443.1 hypothetical protein ELAC_2122 [Estrella lausannensis]
MIDFSAVFAIATMLFIICNPIGNSPAILAIIKDFPIERQRAIMIREGIFSLLIALFFQFFGEWFLHLLDLKDYTVSFCGGLLLFFVSLSLIFPVKGESSGDKKKQEPFIVPIATPLLTGPSLMATIMLKSRELPGFLTLSTGILIAWLGVIPVLLFTPYLQKVLGNKGVTALEQFMGMVLAMIAIQMLLSGIKLFLAAA